jgi:hypothetical protein
MNVLRSAPAMVSGYVSSVEAVPDGVHVTLSGLLPHGDLAFHARLWFSPRVLQGERLIVGDVVTASGDVAFGHLSDDAGKARLLLRVRRFKHLTPHGANVVQGTFPTHLGRSEGTFLKDALNVVLIDVDTVEELSREELPRIGLVVSTKLLELNAVLNFVREIPPFLESLDGQCEVSVEAVLTSDRLPNGRPVGYLISRHATLVAVMETGLDDLGAFESLDAIDTSDLTLS